MWRDAIGPAGANYQEAWTINGQRVELQDLAKALTGYWQDISADFPGIEAIEVVVIDLALRGEVSGS
jgi:hypothetical protein